MDGQRINSLQSYIEQCGPDTKYIAQYTSSPLGTFYVVWEVLDDYFPSGVRKFKSIINKAPAPGEIKELFYNISKYFELGLTIRWPLEDCNEIINELPSNADVLYISEYFNDIGTSGAGSWSWNVPKYIREILI